LSFKCGRKVTLLYHVNSLRKPVCYSCTVSFFLSFTLGNIADQNTTVKNSNCHSRHGSRPFKEVNSGVDNQLGGSLYLYNQEPHILLSKCSSRFHYSIAV
jgi:hypothetical protein